MNLFFKLLLLIITITSCTKEFILDVKVNPPNRGTVFPSEGTFKDGSTVTLNAAPMQSMFFLIGLVMLVEVTPLLMSL